MMQTVEAEINVDGTVTLLEPLRVRVKTKALVTVLGEESRASFDLNVEMPTNESVSDEEVLGVWADRTESAQEIAREIRGRNRQTK